MYYLCALNIMPSSDVDEDLAKAATKALEDVENGKIFKEKTKKEFPSFKRSELGLGPVLGIGGFCTVKEISATKLQKKSPTGDSTTPEENGKDEDQESQPDDDDHLDVASARETIAKQCLRKGDARYAIKRLRDDLPKTFITRGIIDLAVEAKLLTVLCHPNIIKMRGLAEGDVLRHGYFVILDRLYGTLVDKMDEWAKEKKIHNKIIFKTKSNKNHLHELLMDQMVTAFDLAAAFRYLHSMNLVYRDIKPENIGFDVR
mmetsp:Transcript_12402/g.17310  ORF Transcript_12402/g.17310 Transcript_12402/m.17310 type:complete len:259 (+) Transcript_12402:14-790(+)